MGLSTPVFLADPAQLSADDVVLSGAEGWHATVRRIRAGERVDLSDGAGVVAECVVTSTVRGQLGLRVMSRRLEPPPEPCIVAVQAIPKGSRGELAVELLCEVGADVIVPWMAHRCVPRWYGARAARGVGRWRDSAREAAKQARRVRVPEVRELATTENVASMIGVAACALILDAGAPLRLADVAVPSTGTVLVVTGPEGGLTGTETGRFAAAGAVSARLGPGVLRTSTAGAIAVAVLLSGSARW